MILDTTRGAVHSGVHFGAGVPLVQWREVLNNRLHNQHLHQIGFADSVHHPVVDIRKHPRRDTVIAIIGTCGNIHSGCM